MRSATRWAAAALAVLLAITLWGPSALAHPTRTFDSCAGYRPHGGYCGDTASYLYGDRVHLRARVVPAHSRREAKVRFLRPGAERWEAGVSVPISERGRMRWSFRSRRSDADQTEPWRFRFKIRGHGISDMVEVFILFGE